MAGYLDTSFLFKLYVTEPDSASAVQWMQREDSRAMVPSLTDLEMITSVYRTHSRSQAEEIHRGVSSGPEGRGVSIFTDNPRTFEMAITVAERYSHSYRLRSLDALHLATALENAAAEFCTYDGRLADVARAAGLRVVS